MDSRRFPVQANANSLELSFEESPLLRLLRGVQHHEDKVTRLRGRDDLAPSPLTLRGALDDPGEVEQLDLGAAILEHARDGCERREGVRGDLGPRLGDLGEEGGFADGGEADE